MSDNFRNDIEAILKQIPLKKLNGFHHLWAELGYDRTNQLISDRQWPSTERESMAEPPRIIATTANDFHIIYCRLGDAQLRLSPQRPIISRLLQDYPYSLFIFSNESQTDWHLVNVKYEAPHPSPLPVGEGTFRRIFRRISLGQTEGLRTATERLSLLDVETMRRDLLGFSPLDVQQRHDEAFDVEAVTKEFFSHYRDIFGQVESAIIGLSNQDERRLFTQSLFNRLLFIRFLERKGWLFFDNSADYLNALWHDHISPHPPLYPRMGAKGEGVTPTLPSPSNGEGSVLPSPDSGEGPGVGVKNFYQERLRPLFFDALNHAPHGINQDPKLGTVPYLNGGLFELSDLDKKAVGVPDTVLKPIIDDLLYAFNFTVTESTTLDIEVAVDPEMLGKIFEELVTGRHESGSYYTPKPIVSFMGQESMKGYLQSATQESESAITLYVEQREARQLRNPKTVLAALEAVKICDPACGSGAYLLGMLHELLDLQHALFVTHQVDPKTSYETKLAIIQQNVYGVDLDPFAVNIARLRLWLSLIVEYDGVTPPPLPNLDFKIEAGDSLTAPAPKAVKADMFRQNQIQRYFALKANYLQAHGDRKVMLKQQIGTLKKEIAVWVHEDKQIPPHAFDWEVEFAEVFTPMQAQATMKGQMVGIINQSDGQMGLTEQPKQGGFDIVLANPPYIRQELIKELKPALKNGYSEVYVGTADLFVYFYARAWQLLKPQGIMAFITSNKWMRTAYGEKLRAFFLEKTTLLWLIDFKGKQIFNATVDTNILICAKGTADNSHALQTGDDLPEVNNPLTLMPQSRLNKKGFTLGNSEVQDLKAKIESRGVPLKNWEVSISFGIKTGFNEAFIIETATKEQLCQQDPKSTEIIKPILRGRDIKRYGYEWAGLWLINSHNGIKSKGIPPINVVKDYPVIYEYLRQFESQLIKRQDKGEHWTNLRNCAYLEEFKLDKVIYPEFVQKTSFCIEQKSHYLLDTAWLLVTKNTDVRYITSILNSNVMWFYLQFLVVNLSDKAFRMKKIYLEVLPIPKISKTQQQPFITLVDQILTAKRANPKADTQAMESKIDKLVYELYGLTAAEIALVEGGLGVCNPLPLS